MNEETMRWNKRFAADAYNRAWAFMDMHARTAEQDADMLAAAFAQRDHWYVVGEEHQKATADWQVARAFALLGEGRLAVRFAEHAVTRAESGDGPDYLLASCCEGMARAHAAAGDRATRDHWLDRARAALGSIADEHDRAEIAAQIDSVP